MAAPTINIKQAEKILGLRAKGLSINQIAEKIGKDRKTVWRTTTKHYKMAVYKARKLSTERAKKRLLGATK